MANNLDLLNGLEKQFQAFRESNAFKTAGEHLCQNEIKQVESAFAYALKRLKAVSTQTNTFIGSDMLDVVLWRDMVKHIHAVIQLIDEEERRLEHQTGTQRDFSLGGVHLDAFVKKVALREKLVALVAEIHAERPGAEQIVSQQPNLTVSKKL